MPDGRDNIYPIDPIAHSAATDRFLLRMHEIVRAAGHGEEWPEKPIVSHKLGVVFERDEASDALRAAADWLDAHNDMFVEGIALERRISADGRQEKSEIRLCVEFR